MTSLKTLTALGALFEKHRAVLVNYIHGRVNCRATAEDIAQEAYLRLAESAAEREIAYPRAYLFRVALTLSVDRGRHQRVERRHIDPEGEIEDTVLTSPSAEVLVEAQQRWAAMAEALNELPPVCRTVFVMSKLHTMPHGEIAAQLGISRSMVEKHMMRALRHCRKRLDTVRPDA